ncbi:MAG: amidohydrolase family protein [Acidimicrobiales bacterium]
MSEEKTPSPETPQGEKALGRRRLLVGLGFGAANLALLRRLSPNQASPDTPPGTPSSAQPVSSTVPPTPTSPLTISAPPVFDPAAVVDPVGHIFDTVITAGRVIDPASGFDAPAEVGIDGGVITYLGPKPLTGQQTLNASNMVVSPGFIDLLSYPPNGYGEWFKISDGVTSNLCLHGIDNPMLDFLDKVSDVNPPVNYGGATDQARHRTLTGAGIEYLSKVDDVSIQDIVALAEKDLQNGALGIHEQPEYVLGVTYDEMLAHGELAARFNIPLCPHLRTGETSDPKLQEVAVEEVINIARQTGCAVHIDHLNSTGGAGRMAEAIAQIEAGRQEGLAITACIYPYTSWATGAGTERFTNFQEKFGITYNDLQVAGTNQRVTAGQWPEIREKSLLTIAFAMDEEDITTALKAPWVMIGSDAILGPNHNNHPRSAGCFSRVLGVYVRQQEVITLIDALSRMTIQPAQLLEKSSTDLGRRGRLQAGAVADITIFSPETITDNATVADPGKESTGIHHVLVNGQIVRRNGVNDQSVRPGVPLLRDQT